MGKSGKAERVPGSHHGSRSREVQLQGPRPAPLKVKREKECSNAAMAKKPPLGPSVPVQQRQQPIVIYAKSPPVIHTQAEDFMKLVQRLTGKEEDLATKKNQEDQPLESQNQSNFVIKRSSSIINVEEDSPLPPPPHGAAEDKIDNDHDHDVDQTSPGSVEVISSPLFSPMDRASTSSLEQSCSSSSAPCFLFNKDMPFFTPTPRHHQHFSYSSFLQSLPSPSPAAHLDLFNNQSTTQ